MARARTKQELLDFGEKEYKKLMGLVNHFTSDQQEKLEVFDGRSIKDVLAHLHDWHKLVFNWEDQGVSGRKPVMPAEGYTWKELPAFNKMLYEKSKDKSFSEVMSALKNSHAKAMKRIAAYSTDDLETKAKYVWTGTTNIASYYASSTSSHYVWAIDLLKKLQKTYTSDGRQEQ